MFYIQYRTINLVNNKFYIGKHCQTVDPHQFDGYYGSGSQIINAVKKYGKENFIRETLFVFDSNITHRVLKNHHPRHPRQILSNRKLPIYKSNKHVILL